MGLMIDRSGHRRCTVRSLHALTGHSLWPAVWHIGPLSFS